MFDGMSVLSSGKLEMICKVLKTFQMIEREKLKMTCSKKESQKPSVSDKLTI